MYGQGSGVPQDFAEALKWFQLAAELDDEMYLEAAAEANKSVVMALPGGGGVGRGLSCCILLRCH